MSLGAAQRLAWLRLVAMTLEGPGHRESGPQLREEDRVPTALVLSIHNLSKWRARAQETQLPGKTLPYGLQQLNGDFKLTWSDRHVSGIWEKRLLQRIGYAVKLGAPGLKGAAAACYAHPQLRTADVALSVFENVGLGFARSQRLARRRRAIPHVMLTCWLAEECGGMSDSQLRSVRRSVRSVSRVAVFSSNQVRILHDFLGLEAGRIVVVPFGVDTEYYDPATVAGPVGSGGVVAVGVDSGRDYRTLIEAVRIAHLPLTLACHPRNIRGLDLPDSTKLLSGLSHDQYRKLLLNADLVVTPTKAPAYPSGQSVMLEAMSMGKATLTTDSDAIRDYVTNGIDGMLVPPHDPASMAEMIRILLADDDQLRALGSAAAQTVRARFSLDHLWQGISKIMIEVSSG
jgi:glycosyltransferase involved in cell wall biosynthesis